MVGIVHEIGREATIYNGNVNTPRVGYLVALLFSSFYFCRLLGNLTANSYASARRTVLIAYIYIGLMGLFTGLHAL